MESPRGYPESPLDENEEPIPCKGCGEILEEGKAFELAGNRWHIDCFRCNTCNTLLDSDANLLLLGDGSLICNNCTYSCSACHNKIEDLAILTGDQAFCANCFRCRNCKRKIENLRYARTSQGIFCMSCHESLMARRRKRNKKPPSSAGSVPKTDKSLPALPPSIDNSAYTPEMDTPSSDIYSGPPTADVSPRPPASRRNEAVPANFRRDASPASMDDNRKENLTLPASTYREPNHSETSDNGDDGILLPFALDPNPAPGPSPLGKSRKYNEGPVEKMMESRQGRDYFNRPAGNHREMLKESRPGSSRSASADRITPRAGGSPHIAYQEKGRQQSEALIDTIRTRKEPLQAPSVHESPSVGSDRSRVQHATPSAPSASTSTDAFKLQDVPKSKKAGSRRGSKSEVRSPPHASPAADLAGRTLSPPVEFSAASSPNYFDPAVQAREESPATSHSQSSSYNSVQRADRPRREDSLPSSSLKASMARKDSQPKSSPTTPTVPSHERKMSAGGRSQLNGGMTISSPIESPGAKSIMDPPPPPARSAGRAPPGETFTSPRAPPHPPPPAPAQTHRPNESVSTVQSDGSARQYPNGLPRYSGQGDFSMDEEMARVFTAQNAEEKEGGGVLRRVSNAVSKHGRSFSDRGGSRSSQGGHKKWPTNGSIDISSPTVASPDSREENINLRNELRRAQQRIAELEAEKNGLQETVNSAADIKQANTMLREKRNTMAVLDTQREMIIRELEIMTDHLQKAKDSNSVLDINQLKSDVLRDFAASLHKLKDHLGVQIEELIAKRQELTEEISNLIQMKDKGFQEYESLSAQNTKLSTMNRDLIETIQKSLKDNKHQNGNHSIDGGRPPANGLGIYHPHHKGGKSDLSIDALQQLGHEPSLSNLHEVDTEATMVSQPKVVNIQKGKPNKFNWKKGGQAITKNVTKGLNRAFASEPRREEPYNIQVIGTPYGSTHNTSDMSSMVSTLRPKEPELPRGWFGQKGGSATKTDRLKTLQNDNSNSNLAGENSSVLFGSDLTARCDYEKRTLPSIVIKCIQEVEIRGLNQEGIYRKSGGSGQVNQIRIGFEKSSEFNISEDEDLDIHAVTSALKAYLRKLPIPLISYDVYDDFLSAGQIEDPDKKADALRDAIKGLPPAHFGTLEILVHHLSLVIKHEKENLMGPQNLAVVFAPTVMRPMNVERELADMGPQRKAVQALLENYQHIFGYDEATEM